jgi:ParB family chromosome partitioning protein
MVNEQVQYIPISKLIISKYNVRKEASDLTELTNSIRSIGILQPLIVRSTAKGGYEIIAGSRRFAAAKEANLRELPVIVKEITDEDAIIESLSENLQRGDLTLDEIAEGVELAWGLIANTGMTKWSQFLDNFAKKVGKAPSDIENTVKAYRFLKNLVGKTDQIFKLGDKPDEDQRKKGILSRSLVNEISSSFAAQNVKNIYKSEEAAQNKSAEILEFVKAFTTEDAKKIVQRFRSYPEKPLEELQKEVEARKTFVPLPRNYVSPEVIRTVEEFAKKEGKTVDIIMPEIVNKGVEIESKRIEMEKIIKNSPPKLAEALKKSERVSPNVAKKILELPEEKQTKAVETIETFRLDEEEALKHIDARKMASSKEFEENIQILQKGYDSYREQVAERLSNPVTQKRTKLFENLDSHRNLERILDTGATCPICGSKDLGWLCHDLNIHKATLKAKESYENSKVSVG